MRGAAQMVVIVYTDRTRQECTEQEATVICKDKQIKGRIIDALTDNKELQASLRALIDT